MNGRYTHIAILVLSAAFVALGSELPFAALCIKGRIRLIPPPASKKISRHTPPRPTYNEGKPDGGMFRDHDAGFVGTLTPSTISRFCASDIPAEYSP